MKKKRIVASLMATIMTLSIFSSNVAATEVVVDDTTVAVEETVVDETDLEEASENGDIVLADESVVSGSAVEAEEAAIEDEEEQEQPVVAMDGWLSGTTGSSSSYKVTPNGNSVDIQITKVNTGKVSGTEDSVAYYMYELPVDYDFTLSGNLTINAYNNLSGASNPQQTSVGMAVFDQLWTGGGTTNSLWLMSYAAKSTDSTAAFYGASRTNESSKDMGSQLSDSFPISGSNLGTYELKIVKSGNSYVVSVGDNSWAYAADDDMFTDNIYVGFYGARGANISVTDIDIQIFDEVVTSLDLVTPPDKTTYIVNEVIDMTGAKVVATYMDGTQAEITDYIVTGFDTSSIGSKTMTLTKGKSSTTIDYEVLRLPCTNVELVSEPVRNEYAVGTRFNSVGLEAVATFQDGTTLELDEESYAIYLNDKKIDDDYFFTKEDVGTQTIKVVKAEDDLYSTGTGAATFTINVSSNTFTSMKVVSLPGKTTYYVGDEFEPLGLSVAAIFTGSDTSLSYIMKDDEYVLSGYSSTEVGTQLITVTSVNNPEISTTFPISLLTVRPVRYVIDEYPRTTYSVGEKFDTYGMVFGLYYTNEYIEPTDKYTVEYLVKETDQNGNTVERFVADSASDIEKGITHFQNTEVGTTTVRIVPDDTDYSPVDLTVTIVEPVNHYWKSTYFGQSTSASGNTCTVLDDGSVQVAAKAGAGKITADHDGIAYYYTRVSDSNNFVIEGDVTVNKYLSDGIDENRNGQEAFGFMFRDVIPLLSKDGSTYVIYEDDAQLDENGEPIPTNSGGSIFQSNIALLGGYSGTTWPTDPSVASYVKNTNINRINLMWRTGANQTEEAATVKNGPVSLSTALPVPGDKYHLTLRKINGGIFARCYNYQTGETMETYQYLDSSEMFLDMQNENYSYVGFFAARYADITVSDFTVYESDPATDPITYNVADEAVAPNITLVSSNYSTTVNYDLMLKATNVLGGFVTIKQNGKVIYNESNMAMNKKSTTFPVTLEPNTVNTFTILYEPNLADALTSTDSVLITITVTHKGSATSDDVIYVSPNGSIDAAGTREDPLDLETAIGLAKRGQKIIALEGVYTPRGTIEIPETNTGTYKVGKFLYAEDGAEVVLDMQRLYAGIVLEGSYWHIKGIDITNTADNQKAFHLAGNNCIIEDCKFYNNGDTGFQVSRNSDAYETIDEWPTNNLILNCESFNNSDPAGINADGFGAKLTVGYTTIFKGCVSHHNNDDGWDCYTKAGSGAIGAVTLENCVSYSQGTRLAVDGSESAFDKQGGNNGFKMGGENIAVQHYLKDCITYKNGGNGITSNSNPTMKIRNMIAYENNGSNFSLYTNSDTARLNYNYDLKGCISYGSSDGIGTLNKDSGGYLHKMTIETATDDKVVTQSYDFSDSKWAGNNKYVGVNATSVGDGTTADTLTLTGYYKNSEVTGYDYIDNHAINVARSTVMTVRVPAGTTTISMNGCYYAGSANVTIDAVSIDENAQVVRDENGNVIVNANVVSSKRYTPAASGGNEDSIVTFTYTGDEETTLLFSFSGFLNANDIPVLNETNFFRNYGSYAMNSEGTAVKKLTIEDVTNIYFVDSSDNVIAPVFKSINPDDSFTNGRYSQNEDGTFILGDFLARVTPYVHDDADLVYYDQGIEDATSGDEPATEATTNNSETTTKAATTTGGNSGGGGSTAKLTTTTTVTTEADTEATTVADETTEATTVEVNVNLFNDIDSRPWAVDAINALAELGIINGVGEGKFAPDANCKRADFVIILNNILGLEGTATDNFDDVDASKYYANAVGLAKEAGIINGYGDGNFGPENYCTREELMVMLANALAVIGVDIGADEPVLDIFDDADEISVWAKPYVAYLTSIGAVTGTGNNLEPGAYITRAQVAVLMFNILSIQIAEAAEEVAEVELEEIVEEIEEDTVEEAAEETVEDVVEE